MSLEVFPFTAFDFSEQAPNTDVDLVNEEALAVDGIAKTATHVDLHDRNDPLGYYGGLLDITKGDIRAASHILMDHMVDRKLF